MNISKELCSTDDYYNAILIVKAIGDLISVNSIILEVEDILQNIFIKTGIDLKTNLSRKPEIADIRFIYCKMARDTGVTLEKIGKPIHRDFSSVIYSLKKFDDYYKTNLKFRELYEKITKL
jgi:chromosomal replication initiation ATPase DnaA